MVMIITILAIIAILAIIGLFYTEYMCLLYVSYGFMVTLH